MASEVILSDSNRPSPTDFLSYFPWACLQFEIEEPIYINKVYQNEQDSHTDHKSQRNKSKTAKVNRALSNDSYTVQNVKENSVEVQNMKIPANAIQIWAVFDKHDNLMELLFDKTSKVPQKVLKVLNLILPFHDTLHAITVKGRIDKYTIPEISNIMLYKNITDICFDGVFLREGNFYLLFDNETLKSISLARCRINDDAIELMSQKLYFLMPASKCLTFLNLSSNFITNTGAKFLGEALRSNRQLYYLNLSGNRITDVGAAYILDSLLEFPMKIDESVAMKTRYIDFLKKRNEHIEAALKELNKVEEEKVKSTQMSKDKKGKAHKHDKVQTQKNDETALAVSPSFFGVHQDPFLTDTVVKDGLLWSRGNNVLCFLNLAYNDLTYFTITKLLDVVRHQKVLDRKPRGLAKVVLHGNRMPYKCQELSDLDEILDTAALMAFKQSSVFFSKRRITVAK